jgi:NTE family protein
VTATDILKGELVYFSSGNLSQSLMASSCIPMLFQPVQYKTLFVDGGVLNNFLQNLYPQCDIIIGSYVNSIKNEVDQVHMNNVMDRCFHLAMKGSVQSNRQLLSHIEPPNMSQFSIFNLGPMKSLIMAINTHVLSKTDKRTQPLGSRNLKIVLSRFATLLGRKNKCLK